METTLRYVDTYALTSVTGSIGKQVMYVNSTFDPDNSGTGHQPLYRDTYAALYDQYAVIACKVTITFIVNSTSAMHLGAVFEDDNSTSTVLNTLLEQNRGVSELVPQATGAPNTHTFVMDWDCARDLNIDPYASETYKTAVGSNPSEVAALLLYSAPADGAANTTSFAKVTLEQRVLFSELSTPTQS